MTAGRSGHEGHAGSGQPKAGDRAQMTGAPRSGGHGGHVPPSGDTRALVISGVLTGIYFVVEPGIGLWTGSVAVTSDKVQRTVC